MSRLLLIVCACLLAACTPESAPEAPASTFSLQSALGGEAGAGFLRADSPRQFRFPEDHGLHPGFRNEWWYLTGNLATREGRRFGYQLTFFTVALPALEGQAANDSAWRSERIWMAHLALTDVAGRRHYAFERFTREDPGLAGASQPLFTVWLQDWQLTGGMHPWLFPWQIHAGNDTIRLDLKLDNAKPPVLQGEDGLSRKSATPGNASYYYSLTRMPTRGSLQVEGERFNVTGLSWLDREWSTSALDDDQSGWDWFSLQLDDGTELMYYQLRDAQGNAHPYSDGNLTDVDANQIRITPEEMTLEPLATWTSAAGITYTTAWAMHYGERHWRIEAVLEDQWMDLIIPYWEGAVDVIDMDSGAVVGRGYLEMVRQADSP